MKKLLLIVVVLAVFGGLALSRFAKSTSPVTPVASSVEPAAPSAKSVAAASLESSHEPAPAVAAIQPAAAPADEYPPMSLSEVLAPNNLFYDSFLGVSVTYPPGWSVRAARRWGDKNHQATVALVPPPPLKGTPSMYYQMYPDGSRPPTTEAYLRTMAREKETQRLAGGAVDYRNDPDSFVFREIDGRPSLSYFATFTQDNQVMAEYFLRVLGQKGYVMFFVKGPVKDIQAMIPPVQQMGTTVRIP